jgi:hypothetical protein
MTNHRAELPADPQRISRTSRIAKIDPPVDSSTDRAVAPPPRSLPHHSDRRNRRWVAALSSGLQLVMWCLVGQ